MVYNVVSGTLYVVATPIGNLQDITYRAVEVLSLVDLIACEDTRRTKILLDHYQIKKQLISYYEYNKIKRIDQLLAYLKQGKSVALVSDAGTPGISDPGYSLIKKVIEENCLLEAIPGVSAFLTALVVSGMPMHRFCFEGFLPVKSGARKKILENIKLENKTTVLYESPHRLLKTLNAIKDVFGNKDIVIGRELTKKFEQTLRITVEQAIAYFEEKKPKGEFVIII
ncbi:MAG: 16S rRNA (cytidine(1402)-2'-O)-methyltransferase [Candidatus Omnitrophica bacterium]|nr:16S rRNA (cytidine(1402)-2'-O)-methyltransferase [Candidatus Omnitrophota bacterium]